MDMKGLGTLENACPIHVFSSHVSTEIFYAGTYAYFISIVPFFAIPGILPKEQLNFAVNAVNFVSLVEEYDGLNLVMVNNV